MPLLSPLCAASHSRSLLLALVPSRTGCAPLFQPLGLRQRALWSAVIEGDLWEEIAVKAQRNASVREEQADPAAEGRVEAKVGEEEDEAVDMEIVEEALDVEQQEGCDMPRLHAGLRGVDQRQARVRGAVVVSGAELGGVGFLDSLVMHSYLLRNKLLSKKNSICIHTQINPCPPTWWV